jgi:hypothetical protein
MVAFIQRDASPEIPPPYVFPGVTICSFRLAAELTKLQALCDQWLNIGTLAKRGFKYIAFLPFVDMEIVSYPKMTFGEQPYSDWGYATQQEIYFRFFVWKLQYACGIMVPAELPELFFPYIFVDDSWSMISGRNVIGFPKVMAQFNPPSVSATNPFNVTVSALALDQYAQTTKLDWQPIVKVQPASSAKKPVVPGPQTVWPWVELGTGLANPLLNGLLQDLVAAVPNTFLTVQLKQFRDASSLTEACYQAVLSTPFTPSQVGPPAALGPVTVTVESYASLDIPGALGFKAGKPLQPLLQYSVGLNMSMGQGTTLFVNS